MLQRNEWIRALTAHPSESLKQLATQLSRGCTVTHTGRPQAGLGLLKMNDGAFHEAFYLGEFPLSMCTVELGLPDGRQAAGGSQVMADDAELARALAILDAILAARLPGWEVVAERIQNGNKRRCEEERRRHIMLNETRVDFSLLANADEENDTD